MLDLSDLFRAALDAGEGDSSLAQEVELAKRYLFIESLRMGERLHVEWRLAEPLPWSLRLPPLMLQPLVENAVLHGISKLPEGGIVEIGLWVEGDRLHFRVRNPSPSPGEASLVLQHGTGHALRNIAYRLAYRFNSRARLTGGWQSGEYVCELVMPVQ